MPDPTRPAPGRGRVAVLGGNRIPFARSDSAYAEASNQDMFTAALSGLVDRFGLAGEPLGAVIGGAVLKHSRDFNLMRECVLGTALSPYTPAFDLQQACGTGLQAAIAAADGIAAGRYAVAAAGGVDGGVAGAGVSAFAGSGLAASWPRVVPPPPPQATAIATHATPSQPLCDRSDRASSTCIRNLPKVRKTSTAKVSEA